MHFIAAAIVLAAMQLERNHQIQRMEFVKDYMPSLFSDERINDHDLIYTYDDGLFKDVDSIAEKNDLKGAVDLKNKSIFEPFEDLQNGRKEGSRLYHVFQGSIEEKRLDSFLGHMIGFYLSENMTDSTELMGYSKYMIRVVKSREVIQECIGAIKREGISGKIRRLSL